GSFDRQPAASCRRYPLSLHDALPISLGQLEGPDVESALLRILRRDYEYRWSRLAVLSSLRGAEDKSFRAVLSDAGFGGEASSARSEEYTSELQSRVCLVCRLLLEKKK